MLFVNSCKFTVYLIKGFLIVIRYTGFFPSSLFPITYSLPTPYSLLPTT
ncbi:MAG: hypothetical protein F6J90_15120 [Moorea sp. SIOASIH]|nr:hypothetical protein [Moorena sp. SIOASIH]NEO37587.1 hypothetical protein [Moorena sp. SIOASIH]